jgi:hypothetical protein
MILIPHYYKYTSINGTPFNNDINSSLMDTIDEEYTLSLSLGLIA